MNAIDDVEDLSKFELYALFIYFLYEIARNFGELYREFLSLSLLTYISFILHNIAEKITNFIIGQNLEPKLRTIKDRKMLI
jgi:hypothetical protein